MLNVPWLSTSFSGDRDYPQPRMNTRTETYQVHPRSKAPGIRLEQRINVPPSAKLNEGYDFEKIGATVGALVAFGLYLPTLPIVWIDGPIPVADAAWYLGLAWATTRGAHAGAKVGRLIDDGEELILN